MNKIRDIQDSERTHQSYFPEERLVDTSHERELWAAVVFQAIEDAKWEPSDEAKAVIKHKFPIVSYRHLQDELRDKRQARDFFTGKDGMFEVICFWLDMDTERARRNIIIQWGL